MDSSILSAAQQFSCLALTGFENKCIFLSVVSWQSRWSFDAAAFHRLCDGKANTVTGGGRDFYVCNYTNINRYSYMNFSSYVFPNGISANEGGKFLVGNSNHKCQTVEIEVLQAL